MQVSTDRVVYIPVKLDIPVHLEMLQEHACRLDSGVGMISIAQVTTCREQHAIKVGQNCIFEQPTGNIQHAILPFSSIFQLFVCCCYCNSY